MYLIFDNRRSLWLLSPDQYDSSQFDNKTLGELRKDLDNLTSSIVMAALLTKLIKDKEDLWMFAGMIILSANAGGAWSPIGDVTTIMLWIGGQVSAENIIVSLILNTNRLLL